ncbi:MAG: hypothetical protein SFV52_03745 [Saprospiraceae bacterium]|nr:hypothetical protein [Saprospiraceae bacterium]
MIIPRIFFDFVPLPFVFLITVLWVLLSIEIGYRVGLNRSSKSGVEQESFTGSAVGSMLGLLAFVLAFTFGMAASRFEVRKQLLLEEANAIGTTYLRTDGLPEPQRTECRKLLQQYVDLRANPNMNRKELPALIAASEKLQADLWVHAMTIPKEGERSPLLRSLFVQTLNQLIDMHTARITMGVHNRVPTSVWIWLFSALMVSMMALGYQSGLIGKKRVLVSIMLALIFSSVVLLITDLDRAGEGTVKVNIQPLLDLKKTIDATVDAPFEGS